MTSALKSTDSFSSEESNFNDDSDNETDAEVDVENLNNINSWTSGAEANLRSSRPRGEFVVDRSEDFSPRNSIKRANSGLINGDGGDFTDVNFRSNSRDPLYDLNDRTTNMRNNLTASMKDSSDLLDFSDTPNQTEEKSIYGRPRRGSKLSIGVNQNQYTDAILNENDILRSSMVKPDDVDDVAGKFLFSSQKSIKEDYEKILKESDFILNSSNGNETSGKTGNQKVFSYDDDLRDFVPRQESGNLNCEESSPKSIWKKLTSNRMITSTRVGLSSDHNEYGPEDDETDEYKKDRMIPLGNGYFAHKDEIHDKRTAIIFLVSMIALGSVLIAGLSVWTPWKTKAVGFTPGYESGSDDYTEDVGSYKPPEKTKSPSMSSKWNPESPAISPSQNTGGEALTADDILNIILTVSAKEDILKSGTFQFRASKWLAEEDPLLNSPNTRMTDERIIQRYILATLYYALSGDDSWRDKTDWLSGKHECEWNGISCNANENLDPSVADKNVVEYITGIDLTNNGLIGQIPREIGFFRNLKSLWLFENNISGTIPAEILKLSTLLELYLDGNKISGTIPKDIGLLMNLESLDLSTNLLRGKIPNGIGNMENLADLRLRKNALTGEFPVEILDLRKMRTLLLDENEIEGRIPKLLSELVELRILRLSGNELYGSIPDELGRLSNLRELYLDDNDFTGSIPTSFSKLKNLQKLYLTKNSLSQGIPRNIGSLSNLEVLRVDFNPLRGSIPTELGNLGKLRELHLEYTSIFGQIPDDLKTLSNLVQLHMENNELTGELPDWIGQLPLLQEIVLNNNNLQGTIPEKLAQLESLDVLHLENNFFSGTISGGICGLNLETLIVDCDEVSCACCTFCPPKNR